MEIFLIAVLGACFGSFITAASWRLPRDISVIAKPSHCPKCKKRLGVLQLIPIFSYIITGGKCAKCGKKIGGRYFATEIISCLMFVLLFMHYGLNPEFWIIAMLYVALAIMIIADLETFIMPDSTTIAVAILGLAWGYVHHLGFDVMFLNALFGLGVALFLKFGLGFALKKDPLGWGDVKFLPAIGIWLELQQFGLLFFLSGVLGILTFYLYRNKSGNKEFPFGPSLALSLFLIVIFKAEITAILGSLAH